MAIGAPHRARTSFIDVMFSRSESHATDAADAEDQVTALQQRALEWAAQHGQLALLQCLCELPLARGVDPGADHNRALVNAAEHGHLQIVRFLCELPLSRGVDPGADDNRALINAAEHGHLQIVRFLCELHQARGVEPAAQTNAALIAAARMGRLNVVRYLCELPLARGVEPAAQTNVALVVAAANGHADIVRYLCALPLTRGVCAGADGNRAIINASLHGHTAVVRMLCELPRARGVEACANRNEPLRLAAWKGHLSVVQFLCQLPQEWGVVPSAMDNNALTMAATCGHLHVVQYLCEHLPVAMREGVMAGVNAALWEVVRWHDPDDVSISTLVAMVTNLYDLPDITRMPHGTHALPPWRLINNYAAVHVNPSSDEPLPWIYTFLFELKCLVQAVPGGDQWLDHDGGFKEEHLAHIVRYLDSRSGHELLKLARQRRVWRRRRTMWLMRALRDSHRARWHSRTINTRQSLVCT